MVVKTQGSQKQISKIYFLKTGFWMGKRTGTDRPVHRMAG